MELVHNFTRLITQNHLVSQGWMIVRMLVSLMVVNLTAQLDKEQRKGNTQPRPPPKPESWIGSSPQRAQTIAS